MTNLDNNHCKVEFLYSLPNGADGVNVWHFKKTAAFTDTTLGNLNDAVKKFWTTGYGAGPTAWKTMHPTQVTLNDLRATTMELGNELQVTTAVNVAGTGTSPIATESATVVTWYTAGIGRSKRGRTYFPCPPEALVDDTGQLAPANVTAAQAMIDKWLAGYAAETGMADVFHGVLSRTLDDTFAINVGLVRRALHHQSRRNAS